MEATAISVKGISKKFRLFNSPQERFLEAFHPFNKKYHKEFWALRDVSFDIPKGKTVGIIGRNGSGKSTLLQVLCSILKPTSGAVVANGKIAALLELGAGFNPEFTGRQNVLMKGMLMGFSQKEMRERLPEIEAFADIGEFIDQPMKIYSSGMAVRLAFACAVNVDPEILVIDEALAVGDAKFQHKCYGKFLDFQQAGKTIVFVTHDINAMVRHCDSAILLEKGKMLEMDEPKAIANYYTDLLFTGSYTRASSNGDGAEDLPEHAIVRQDGASVEVENFMNDVSGVENCKKRKNYNKNEYRHGDGRARIVDYLIVEGERCDPVNVRGGANVDIYLKIKYNETIPAPMTGFTLKTVDGILVYGTNTMLQKIKLAPVQGKSLVVYKWSFKADLASGDYFIDLGCGEFTRSTSEPLDRRYGISHIHVESQNQHSGFAYLHTSFDELSKNAMRNDEEASR